jgi:predicted esterase
MPAGRQSELNAGQWYEWEDDVEVNAHSDTATKEAAVESFITAEEQKRLDQMAHKLRFFGYTGTV